MSAHTPGPWIADGNLVLLANRATYPELIATTAKMLNPEANARLIAAAPELLEALKIVDGYLSQRVVGTGGFGETRVLPFIRAAIAKAEGRS